jgi:ribosomal protein S12 methylthiotransferase accessory factor
MTSNGLASGNHIFEATAHAISELIERDADTLFSLLPAPERARRAVRLASIDVASCRQLLDRFASARVQVKVWNITTDIGVPAFRAVIMDDVLNPDRPLRPNVGMGCHPSREIALSRALTEAAQSRLTVISSSRDDLARERYTNAADLSRLEQTRIRAMQGEPETSFADIPEYIADDFESDIGWQKERLMAFGIEHLVAVELTKPGLDIPVVRVIAGGLEMSREVPGWAPGARARALLQRIET